MKKTDIKEGVTYQNKGGNSARKVLRIAASPGHSLVVKYKQERGPYSGTTSALTLDSFSSWAFSEDAGAPESVAELREKLARAHACISFASFRGLAADDADWRAVHAKAIQEAASEWLAQEADRGAA